MKLNVRRTHGVNILAIKRHGEMSMNIQADTVLAPDCTLLVLGETRALRRTFKL